jgi:polyvinyl alcohol dehydrogenase (cytochrome)
VVPLTVRGAPLLGIAAFAALALAAPASTAEAASRCASGHPGGGEWPTFGHDYANTRTQDHEKVISPGDVPLLSPAWTFSTVDGGGEGDITGTPIVTDGCLYTATTEGSVFALNAATGKKAWKAQVPYGGGITGSVAVKGRRVYAAVSRTQRSEGCPKRDPCIGPYVVAFKRRTGKVDWATSAIDTQPGADVYGSPVIFKRTLLIGVSGGSAELGDEADRYAFQGSMSFIGTRSGKVLEKTWTIHRPNHPKNDFAGAGIWSTPAIDRRARVAYAGTANPFRPQAEHKHANAVLKFELDRHSRKFGKVIGSYKGNVDEYFAGVSELPCFDIPGNPPPYYPQGVGSCGDIDLDFGASPNLFRDASGRKLVGAGQKSGVYHVFNAKTMKPAWTQIVGPPGALGGIVGSTAYDGHSIFGPITVPGYLWSVSADEGSHRWIAPVADGAHWGPPVAVANGVVYTVDLTGFLDAFDARTGALLAKRPLALGGTSSPASLAWGGVSIARHTIYASVGIRGLPEGFVTAFRTGGSGDVTDDVAGTVDDLVGGGGGGDDGGGDGGDGETPTGSAIVAGPGAASTTYATPVMATQRDGALSFANLDVAQHDVVAVEKGPDGKPLFQTPLIGFGETAPVEGTNRVAAGQTYDFFCSIHPGMRGQLIVR